MLVVPWDDGHSGSSVRPEELSILCCDCQRVPEQGTISAASTETLDLLVLSDFSHCVRDLEGAGASLAPPASALGAAARPMSGRRAMVPKVFVNHLNFGIASGNVMCSSLYAALG
jgi:hypothetical protein